MHLHRDSEARLTVVHARGFASRPESFTYQRKKQKVSLIPVTDIGDARVIKATRKIPKCPNPKIFEIILALDNRTTTIGVRPLMSDWLLFDGFETWVNENKPKLADAMAWLKAVRWTE